MPKIGKFISFEGSDGSGKTTQVVQLKKCLAEVGIETVCVREPGGTSVGESIRDILQHGDSCDESPCPTSEVLLFAASRAQLVRRVIRPALKAGKWVVCDRFVDSTLAYQGYGREISVDLLRRVNDFALNGLMPDLTFLLDLKVERGLARLESLFESCDMDPDRFEREQIAFHKRVREGYLQLAHEERDRFCVLNADAPCEKITDKIWAAVRQLGL